MNTFQFGQWTVSSWIPGFFRRGRLAGCALAGFVLLGWANLAGAQILTNGGFESGFTGWSTSLSGGASATFSNMATNTHSGTNCLFVTVSNPGGASNSVRIVSTSFAASGTNTYVLRFWANTDTLDAKMGVDLLGATPVFPQIPYEISTNDMSSGAEHYQEFMYPFRASGAVSIAFNFQTVANYWIDDVEILDVNNTDGFDIPMTYLWWWGELTFSQTNSADIGWTGGDNDKSCRLPDGTVAWIFNDSYASTLNSFYSNIRGGSSLPRNCLLHQIGTNLVWQNNGANTYFTPANSTPTNQNYQQIVLFTNGIYWIGGSVAESSNNKLYVLLNGLDNSPLSNCCMSVATFSLPGLTLDGVVTNLTSPGTDNFGDLVKGDDGYYYIYNGAKVARVPAGQLATDSAWTFWNGTNWVTDHTQSTNASASLPDFQGWSILRMGISNYVAVYKPTLSLDIYAQFAPTPMGPWGFDVLVATAPNQGGEGILGCYAPNICMGTGSNGIYTIGFSDNGAPESWFSKTASDKSWYNPHFVTAPLYALSPYSLNYTNGGPGSRMSIKFAADQDYNNDFINNTYGAGALNTTNWFNFGLNGGGSGVTNLPYYTCNGQKYVTSAKMVYNYASEKTHTVDSQSKSNNVALLESWASVNNNCWYLSVTNLDGPFTNGYSVYFYFHGSSTGYGGQNYLRYYAGQTTSSTVLGIRQWNLFTTDASNAGIFTQDQTPANTSTTGETPEANYLIFTNLTGGAFDLLITNGYYGGVNAIEIVANTTPAVSGPIVTPATTVYPGTTVSMVCATNGGSAPFSVQWQACADGISWTNLTGASATTTNLVLANVTANNAGYYQMIYTGGYNGSTLSVTSSVVQLALFASLPTIGGATALPSSTVNQGATVTLNCVTNGGGAPFSIQWQAGANGTSYTNLAGATGLPLTLSGVNTNNSGYYQCIYTAAGLSVTSAPALLTVQPLNISPATVLPSNPLFAGQTAILTCSNFAGLGANYFQWQTSATGGSWTNVPGSVTNQLALLGVTTNTSGYYQCVLTAANGSVTSAPVQLKVQLAGVPAARLPIKFAPDQNYNHCYINLNWNTPATKQPAGVLNTTNWNNWNATGSSPYSWNGMFYDVNGKTNGNKSTATIIDYHTTGEQCIYYNGSWPASIFTNNNPVLLDSTFWYGEDQLACVVTNLDPVFANNGYSVYIYYLGTGIGQGQQYLLASYAGQTTSSAVVSNQICSLYTTTNWNSFNNGAYLTNLPSFLKGTAIFTQGVQTTSTTNGGYPAFENAGADYVVFSNCPPGGAFSITVAKTYYAGICGIEIVQNATGLGLLATASTLAASTNSVPPGGLVTFTNTVSPVPPDGEYVVFMDGSKELGLGTLAGGITSCKSAGLAAGTHSIAAVYCGDANYLASTSSVQVLTVLTNPAISAPVALPSGNVYVGTGVTLVCSNYTGTPPFVFQWQTSGSGGSYTNISGATTNQVVWTAVAVTNAGYYQLVFTASGLAVTSSAVQLTVKALPVINFQPVGANLILNWNQGILLQATNVTGPWTTNPATSPFTNWPVNPQMFYRILGQ